MDDKAPVNSGNSVPSKDWTCSCFWKGPFDIIQSSRVKCKLHNHHVWCLIQLDICFAGQDGSPPLFFLPIWGGPTYNQFELQLCKYGIWDEAIHLNFYLLGHCNTVALLWSTHLLAVIMPTDVQPPTSLAGACERRPFRAPAPHGWANWQGGRECAPACAARSDSTVVC